MPKFLLLLLLSALPEAALAHSPVEGLNFFYNGLLHPVLVPTQLLALISLGLFLGQQPMDNLRGIVSAVPIATVLGLIGTLFFPDLFMDNFLLASTTVLGLTVAIKPSALRVLCITAGIWVSFLVGLDSSQGELNGSTWFITFLGNVLGITLMILYTIGISIWCQKVQWKSVGIRIGGSWLTASSFLVFALANVQ